MAHTEPRQIPCEPVNFETIAVETSVKRFFTTIYPCLQTAAIFKQLITTLRTQIV